jgi:hypothetical protein
VPLLEIRSVTTRPSDGVRIGGASIDIPKAGQRIEAPAMEIEGWVVPVECGKLEVEFVSRGSVLRRIPVDRIRNDVSRALPALAGFGPSGFRGSILIDDWGEHSIAVQAVLSDRSRVPLAEIAARTLWREPAEESEAPMASIVILSNGDFAAAGKIVRMASAQTYPHIEVVVVGPFAAEASESILRNLGVRRSTGDYLLFLGEKDSVSPEAIARALRAFRERPESAVECGLFRRSFFESAGVFDLRARDPEREILRRRRVFQANRK